MTSPTAAPANTPPQQYFTAAGQPFLVRVDIAAARRLRAAGPALDILGEASLTQLLADELLVIQALEICLQDQPATQLRDLGQLLLADETGQTMLSATAALCGAVAVFFRRLGRQHQAAELASLAADLAAAAEPHPSPA